MTLDLNGTKFYHKKGSRGKYYYQTVFHKFVDVHQVYLGFEDGEEEKAYPEERYEKEKELPFTYFICLFFWGGGC